MTTPSERLTPLESVIPSSSSIKPPTSVAVRIRTGLLTGGVVCLGAFFGPYAWATMMLLIFFPYAIREMQALMHAKQIYPSRLVCWSLTPMFYVFALFGWQKYFDLLITLGIVMTFSGLLFRKNPASISDIGGTILTLFYIGLLPAHFLLIHRLGMSEVQWPWQATGVEYLFLVLLIVSSNDVFAYFGGKRFGKNLLSPLISPKKTIEGSLFGLVFATVMGFLFALYADIPWYHGMILGLLLSLVAQLGDLSESLLKRDAGIKDSGTLFPGHGGILDRTDGYIFAGAVGYYYINWVILHQGLAHEVLTWLTHR